MPNIVTPTIVIDGRKNLIVSVYIEGDGSGEEANTLIVDASALDHVPTKGLSLVTCQSALEGFSGLLLWDATTNIPLLQLPNGSDAKDFWVFGGLRDPQGAGATGDVLLSTVNLGVDTSGTIVMEFRKHGVGV